VSRAVVIAAAALVVRAAVADPGAAEAQYRLAQRLAADRSPDAAPAFEKVVALAPEGPLADDALLGLARLKGAPEWPEDAVRLEAASARAAAGALATVRERLPGADRASEARYLEALILLAPLPSRDPGKASQALITVATGTGGEPWRAKARYAIGWLAENEGAADRAAGAYARVVVESPGSDAAVRARVGFARTCLRQERFGEAAVWLQEAVEADAPRALRAAPLRTLAAREIVRGRDPQRRWSAGAAALATTTTTRGASLLATGPDGAVVVFDRRNGVVQLFDARGAGGPPMPQEDVSALAADGDGRVYAVANERLMRWDGSTWTAAGTLGPFAGASSLAVDTGGSVWLIDRRGDRIGRIAPGAPSPVVVHEGRGMDLASLAAVAGGVIAAEGKTGRLVHVTAAGTAKPFGPAFRRPVALCADRAGRIAVLDTKAETLTRLSPAGEIRDTLSLAAVEKPLAIAAADDGAVRILDGSTGNVVAAP
jgi:tetratricopeptide (TPR) repeat protein